MKCIGIAESTMIGNGVEIWDEDEKKLELMDACEQCGQRKACYTCPGCFIRTCSLQCSQSHKTSNTCDGIASRTRMVPLEKYDALTLLSDYRLLQESTRVAAKRMDISKGAKRNKEDFKKIRNLVAECLKRGIKLEMTPVGMERSLNNTSAYNRVAETVFWRIEWRFVDAQNYCVHTDNNPESVKLSTLLRQFTKARRGFEMIIPTFCNSDQFAAYQLPTDCTDIPWNCYMKVERNGWTKDTRYYKLAHDKTIKENLRGKVVIEFPTIYVTASSCDRFPLLTEKSKVIVYLKFATA